MAMSMVAKPFFVYWPGDESQLFPPCYYVGREEDLLSLNGRCSTDY